MIVSKIIGGLGNQLFQYAAGRSLSLHHQTELKLDISEFDTYKLRNFDLNAFQFQYEVAEQDEIAKFSNRSFFKKVMDRIGPYSKRTFFREKYFHFHQDFLKYPSNSYLKGYWQSEKYFLPAKDIIKKDLTFKKEYIENVASFAKQIANKNTVSLHIRRGDYSNKVVYEMHGIIPVEYYLKAVDLIKDKTSEIKLLIFSDDIEWTKKHFNFPNTEFVSGDISKTHFEDLYLMSVCKHNIIANSSFSWWGAWLNENPDKIVIAPKNWFNKGPKDTYDLYPEGWITI